MSTRAGELLLHVQAGLLRLLPAALVQQHLFADLLRVKGVFNKVDLQVAPQELRHGLLDEFVGDGLLGLVLVAGLGGEVVGHQHQAVLDVRPGDLALALLILPLVRRYLSMAETKADLAAFSGEPPCSSQEELW